MKLLDQYIDPKQAAAARGLLRDAGIACLVDSMDPHSVQPSKSGTTHIGLWVLADRQFEDALILLQNPAHAPRHSLSLQEMDRLEASAATPASRAQRLIEKFKVAILLACLLGLIAFTVADFFLDL